MKFIYFIAFFSFFEGYQCRCRLEIEVPNSACSQNGKEGGFTRVLPCGLPIIIVKETVFFTSYFTANYYDAMKYCCDHGMSLISIKNQEKSDTIKKLISSRISWVNGDKYYWTSGNRIGDGNTFIWGDGEPVKFTNWGPGEPNNAIKPEECIEVYVTNEGTVAWNDGNCGQYKHPFICEKPLYE